MPLLLRMLAHLVNVQIPEPDISLDEQRKSKLGERRLTCECWVLLLFWVHNSSLLRYVNTVQKLPDILIFDCGGLLDKSS